MGHDDDGAEAEPARDGGEIVGGRAMPAAPSSSLLRPRPRRSGATIRTPGSCSASSSHARCDDVTPWIAMIVGASPPGSPASEASHTPT